MSASLVGSEMCIRDSHSLVVSPLSPQALARISPRGVYIAGTAFRTPRGMACTERQGVAADQ
eukprot:7692052-Alexandrium_andersonii.AAC.1